MTANGWVQFGIYFAALLTVMGPLGIYMAGVFEGKHRFLRPLEVAAGIFPSHHRRTNEEPNGRPEQQERGIAPALRARHLIAVSQGG